MNNYDDGKTYPQVGDLISYKGTSRSIPPRADLQVLGLHEHGISISFAMRAPDDRPSIEQMPGDALDGGRDSPTVWDSKDFAFWKRAALR